MYLQGFGKQEWDGVGLVWLMLSMLIWSGVLSIKGGQPYSIRTRPATKYGVRRAFC